MLTTTTVAHKRKYTVLDVKSAKKVAAFWLQRANLENAISFGLPEVDDRYHIWRVPLVSKASQERIGEVVIDAYTSLIIEDKSTSAGILESRLLGRNGHSKTKAKSPNGAYVLSALRNTIGQGDSEELLQELPAGSVNLIFTSPPYYNARPEYTDYVTYEEYLLKISKSYSKRASSFSGRLFLCDERFARVGASRQSKRSLAPYRRTIRHASSVCRGRL